MLSAMIFHKRFELDRVLGIELGLHRIVFSQVDGVFVLNQLALH